MKKFFILDGNALLHRSWHAIPPLATAKGEVVNAVYGFAMVIEKLLEQYELDYFAVAWDLPGGTFRHEAYEEYKATRKKKEPELYEQIPKIKELLEAYDIKSLSKEGLEADDIIGILANEYASDEIQVTIVTGDYDSLQLVNDNVKVLAFIRGVSKTKLFGRQDVFDKFGVWPEQMVDYKALAGDSSDNIPGFKGIGAKTAVNLLGEYQTIDGIFKALDEGILPEKFIKYFEGKRDFAEEMRFLVTIVTENGLEIDLSDFTCDKPNLARLLVLFEAYEFRTFIAKYREKVVEEIGESKDEVEVNTDSEEVLLDNRIFIGFADDLFAFDGKKIIRENILEAVQDFKGDFLLFDAKAIKHELDWLPEKFFDLKLASYIVASHARDFSLSGLLSFFMKKSLMEDDMQKMGQIIELEVLLRERLGEGDLLRVLEEVELPLVEVLYGMEKMGIKVDLDQLSHLAEETNNLIDALTIEIYDLANKEFNINSTQQLSVVLFEDLGLNTKKIKKTKTGFSTAASELEKLWDEHEIVPKISEYRELAKMKSTYIDALPKLVAEDGRLHTTYNQTGTSTGRLSSLEPNLQNIPIRSELGMKIRRAFIPEDDYVLLAADYSQIELRIVTELSGDEAFRKAFNDGADIHTRTAALMLGKDEADISKDERRSAKAVNFGILYGMGARALARNIGTDQKTAKKYIERYFEIHPGVADYMDRMKGMARSEGFVETMFGRRRYFPEIQSNIPMMIAAGERMAINFPAQGSQADLLKMAMVKIFKIMNDQEYEARMLLQVHDELVFEVPKEWVGEFSEMVQREMIGVWPGKIPLIVDCHVGDNWADLKEL